MKLSSLRAGFALFLIIAAFSSAPFGSLEQPPVAHGEQTLVVELDGAVLAPLLGARALQSLGLDVPLPSRPTVSFPPLAVHAPPASTDGRRPPATASAHFTYDALAPPRI